MLLGRRLGVHFYDAGPLGFAFEADVDGALVIAHGRAAVGLLSYALSVDAFQATRHELDGDLEKAIIDDVGLRRLGAGRCLERAPR